MKILILFLVSNISRVNMSLLEMVNGALAPRVPDLVILTEEEENDKPQCKQNGRRTGLVKVTDTEGENRLSDSPDHHIQAPPLKVRPWSARNSERKNVANDENGLQMTRSKTSLDPSRRGYRSKKKERPQTRSWAVTELEGSTSEEEEEEEEEEPSARSAGNYAEKKQKFSEAMEAWIQGDPYNSDDYDTDLEQEVIDKGPERKLRVDATGAYHYVELCEKKGVVPVSYIIRHLGDRRLRMRHHYLGNKGIKILSEALQRNTVIEALDLCDNYLDEDGAKNLAFMLRDNMFITNVDISMNFIKHVGALSIADMLDHNTTLKTMSLSGNQLTDKDARVLGEALKNNASLTCLDLSHNNFGEAGGVYLAVGLGANEGLTDIDLSWNAIRQKGAAALATSLKANRSLEILDISWNGMSLHGCTQLAKTLKVNTTLKVLDISNNRLGTQAVQKLSIGLKYNQGLETLLMSMNPAGEAGMEALVKALAVNDTLKLLAIEDITLTPNIYLKIKELEEKKEMLILHGGLGGYSKARAHATVIKLFDRFITDNRQTLETVFKHLDKDGSGDVSIEELKQGLKLQGLRLTNRMIDLLLEEMDTDKSGTIEYSELLQGQALFHEKMMTMEKQEEMLNPKKDKIAATIREKRTLMSRVQLDSD
ncbi:leucine-rich repeat-containing protein 74B-like isoform X2 [Lineus longissimus]|uniref:leucine-rich repeat-containing protein 74B-like isoform X2 n=1 Tax=Lineus longissimus TaxID=88925 RepID=UPI00315D45A3